MVMRKLRAGHIIGVYSGYTRCYDESCSVGRLIWWKGLHWVRLEIMKSNTIDQRRHREIGTLGATGDCP